MSSLWEKPPHKSQVKKFYSCLSSLSQNSNNLNNRQSKAIHQIFSLNHSKSFSNTTEETIPKRIMIKKKQTILNVRSRHHYQLPVMKHKTEDAPVIEFSQALTKIQDIFKMQFQKVPYETQFRYKKDFSKKAASVNKNQLQSLSQIHQKKRAKKQFQLIIQVFNKIQPIQKNQKKELSLKKKKISPFSITNNNIAFKQAIERKSSHERLTQNQREEFLKQARAFQKSESHLILKSYTVKIFYHHLSSELALQSGVFEDALLNLYYCEYYARKIDFDSYVIPCLIIQSQIKQSLYDYEEAIKILKTALQFSIIKKWKEMELRVLQKISIVYYYRGNSYMARFYKGLSEVGLDQSEAEAYFRQYSKSDQLKFLEAKLFSLPFDIYSKKKYNEKEEANISRDLCQKHAKLIFSHQENACQMLKNNRMIQIGTKIKKLIAENCKIAEVNQFNEQEKSLKNSFSLLPGLMFEYPIENCGQVLKSHLSKGKSIISSHLKNISFTRTLDYLKTLYKRLCLEINNQKLLQNIFQKDMQNIQEQEKQNICLFSY